MEKFHPYLVRRLVYNSGVTGMAVWIKAERFECFDIDANTGKAAKDRPTTTDDSARGTASRIQSAMPLTTQSFAAAHTML
jgi:hypothetical protein